MSAVIPLIEDEGAALSAERALIGCLFLDAKALDSLDEQLAPEHFEDPRCGALLRYLRLHRDRVVERETGEISLPLLRVELERDEALAEAGGAPYLAQLADEAAAPSLALSLATEVKRAFLGRQIRKHAREIARYPSDREAMSMLTERSEELQNIGSQAGSHETGFSGSALMAFAEQDEPVSLLPGFLDPDPNLHLLHGCAKTGKTTLAWMIALAWASGLPPWPGAPSLPGSRVLILSGEQSVRKCVRVLRRIAETSGIGQDAGWFDRVTVVGRHSKMTGDERALLEMDDKGLLQLRSLLNRSKSHGDPFGLVVADSLTRLKPAGFSTNDNDEMTAVLSPLAAICVETETYGLMIHHDGHNPERQGQAIDGVRGASAIRDVPQALWAVSRVKDEPRQRRVRIAGNELPDADILFEVAGPEEPEGYIQRFQPLSSQALDLEEIFSVGPLNLTEFGRRAFGWAADRAPSGGSKEKAKAVLKTAEEQGLIRKEGKRWKRSET